MENGHGESRPILTHVEPMLAVKDVSETVLYWHNVLGFADKWTWGDPVNHGGVSWHGVYIQFSQNPRLASVSKGNSIFIRVRELENLYHFHQKKNAEIVEPLENKLWGMAGYTVREINGYFIIFAGAPISEREKSTSTFPQTVRIITRTPDTREYLNLVAAVGWGKSTDTSMVEKILAAPLFAVVAEDAMSNEIIGCALLLSDHARFFYVKRRDGSPGLARQTCWIGYDAETNTMVGQECTR